MRYAWSDQSMQDRSKQVAVEVVPSIEQIGKQAWNACAGRDDPFLSYEFLHALEVSGSVTAETGWLPQHLAVRGSEGEVVGVAPLYVKGHSYGEYVFDWSWASAYKRSGLPYYPKLQGCVPFTPVGGSRLLAHPEADGDEVRKVLVAAMLELASRHRVSGLHLTFLSRDEQRLTNEMGLMARNGIQYHWHNRGYGCFDDFLATLMSRKRKAIKKERREAASSGVRLRVLRGDDIKAQHWDAFYEFYVSTIDRKWGSPYLEREFFHLIGESMADRIALVVGERDGELVAGALNLVGTHALYGRYWGCAGRYRFLHFEACYHQAIELAIELGLERVEAGAQGQHKIQRGYVPERTYSAHYIVHPEFREAIREFLQHERGAIAFELAALGEQSPYQADRAKARGLAPPVPVAD
jgi:hypothetical protein